MKIKEEMGRRIEADDQTKPSKEKLYDTHICRRNDKRKVKHSRQRIKTNILGENDKRQRNNKTE